MVPARLLQVAQAAMQRAQRQSRGGAAFGLACGAAGRGGQRRLCFLINVTSTEHLHQRPTHAVTGMSKAAMETLWEKVGHCGWEDVSKGGVRVGSAVMQERTGEQPATPSLPLSVCMPRTQVALEQCPGIVACSADPGFVSVSEQALRMLCDCVTAGFRPHAPMCNEAADPHACGTRTCQHCFFEHTFRVAPFFPPPYPTLCPLWPCFQGVTTPERKPLTAADGAARVLYPLMAWSSGRLPEDTLASVLVWKDFLPLRVVPAAKQALWALHMHPLAAALSGGPSEMASARGSAGAADVSAGKLGEPEVVQALGGWKVSRSASMSSAWQCRAPLLLLSLLPPTCSVCRVWWHLAGQAADGNLIHSAAASAVHLHLAPAACRYPWLWAALCARWGPLLKIPLLN